MNKAMNKAGLIDQVSKRTDMTKKDVEKVLGTFTDVVTETLVAGDKVSIVGFGTFETVERAARTARNPRTGETVEVGPSKAPKFKAGKNLKEAVKTQARQE